MRLNLALLRATHEKPAGATGAAGAPSNDAALTAPLLAKVSRGTAGQESCQHQSIATAPAAPELPRIWRGAETQQPRGAPAAPAAPDTKRQLATIAHTKPELVALLAANDPIAQPFPHASRTPAREISRHIVLTFELDGRHATCIDPVSASLAEAATDLHWQFPCRVGRIWRNDEEVLAQQNSGR